LLPEDRSPDGLEAYQFRFESPRIRLRPEFAEYARQVVHSKAAAAGGLLDLTARIHKDFRFDSKVTNVRTPPKKCFASGAEFARTLRTFKLPACVLSLAGAVCERISADLSAEGVKPRLVGADASHAWVSAYCPGSGWLDLDPTNNVVPSNGHVTLAWGRDYGDVSPLRGLILGGGVHALSVAVDMEPKQPDCSRLPPVAESESWGKYWARADSDVGVGLHQQFFGAANVGAAFEQIRGEPDGYMSVGGAHRQ
jgi:transglutaminase-like putative cysteine protease